MDTVDIDTLISTAREVVKFSQQSNSPDLSDDGQNDELVVERVVGYLDAFEVWRTAHEVNKLELDDFSKDAFRTKLIELQSLHLEVMSLVESRKACLSIKLQDVNVRAKALRSYVDHYPSRINITGRRKG